MDLRRLWQTKVGNAGYDLFSDEVQEALRHAQARIDKHRKGDVALRLTSSDGRPLTGVSVEIEQLRHAFPFGANTWFVDTARRTGSKASQVFKEQTARFAEVFNASFSQCYWTERAYREAPNCESAQGDATPEAFDCQVNWALSNGLSAKGHVLYWPVPKAIPSWLLRYDYETRMKFLEVRVRNLVSRYRGRVRQWDTVCEHLWEPTLRDTERRVWPHIVPVREIAESIAPVFRWARQEDPEGVLVLDDYGIENDNPPKPAVGGEITATGQRRRMVELAQMLIDRGCPPSAVGSQTPTGETGILYTPRQQMAVYDELTSCGLPLQLTGYWVKLPKDLLTRTTLEEADAIEAEYANAQLTIAFSHPRVSAIYLWGILDRWDHYSVRDASRPRRVWARLRELIREQWWTRARLVSDDDGRIRFRGFTATTRHACAFAAVTTGASGLATRPTTLEWRDDTGARHGNAGDGGNGRWAMRRSVRKRGASPWLGRLFKETNYAD